MAQVKSSSRNYFENFHYDASTSKLLNLENQCNSLPEYDSFLQLNKHTNSSDDNNDSGFGTNSDGDNSNSSDSLPDDNNDLDLVSELQTNKTQDYDSSELHNSYDFWNKSHHKKNKFELNGDNNGNEIPVNQSISHDSSNNNKLDLKVINDLTFSNLLKAKDASGSSNIFVNEESYLEKNHPFQRQNNGQKDLDCVENEGEISLSELLAGFDRESKDKMVVSFVTQTDKLDTELNSVSDLNGKYSAEDELNNGLDLSDFLSSVCILDNDNYTKSSFGAEVKTDVDFSDKSSPSTNDYDNCLSDLLSSISFDDSALSNNNLPLANSVINIKCKDESYNGSLSKSSESDEVSLAALAVKHLSTYKAQNDEKQKISCNGIELAFDSQFKTVLADNLGSDDTEPRNNNFINSLSVSQPLSLNSLSTFRNSAENDTEDVDLTFCFKTVKMPSSPIKFKTLPLNDSPSSESIDLQTLRYSPTFSPQDCVRVSAVPDTKNIHKRESLFSKALYCKTKSKQSALLKVLQLKNDICQQFFNLPVESQKLKKELVQLSNDSIVTSLGRRSFGHCVVA